MTSRFFCFGNLDAFPLKLVVEIAVLGLFLYHYFPDPLLLQPLFLRFDLYLPVDMKKSEREQNSF